MAPYVGLTRTRKGWFGVVLEDDGGWETDHFPTIWSLWKRHSDASRICLDVPIGLPSSARRVCDAAARRTLRERGRSISYAPVREAVYEQNLDRAKEINERAGYSIQNQAWSIVPRIRAVDEFIDMNPGARDRLSETRPELCFHALNGGQPVPPRDTPAGHSRRERLVADEHPAAIELYEHAREQYLEPPYASFLRDETEILDAVVAAITARRPDEQLASLPAAGAVPRDDRGLPMRMVYPRDITQLRLSAAASGSPNG